MLKILWRKTSMDGSQLTNHKIYLTRKLSHYIVHYIAAVYTRTTKECTNITRKRSIIVRNEANILYMTEKCTYY